jgi:hypothetical protein
MADMNINNPLTNLSEEEIDEIVIAQAEDDSGWEEPIQVTKTQPISLVISSKLTAKATLLARLHHANNVEEWLNQIISERIEMEEANLLR